MQSSLVSAAISLGFPTLSNTKTYIPSGRGGGLSKATAVKDSLGTQTRSGLSPTHSQKPGSSTSNIDKNLAEKNLIATQPNYLTSNTIHTDITLSPKHSISIASTQVNSQALPQSQSSMPKSSSQLIFYTYRAQLTFGLASSCREVNAAALFHQWFEKSFQLLPNFSVLPFDEERGQQLTSVDQFIDEAEFFKQSYHNHRVLPHGNLTGMIHFQTSTPWIALKRATSKYFTWLKECRVFLNQTKFKTDNLVACGFLVGAHPGYLRRDEAEEELKASLDINSASLPFQLSSRSISVPVKEGELGRYSFQAVVIETSTRNAAAVREKFYELDNPTKTQEVYPYTGMYQFVPLIKSKEWPISKIFQLAQLHVSIVENLRPLYLANLQDINHLIDTLGNSLMQGFYGMTMPQTPEQVTEGKPGTQLIHSVHNTSKLNTKVVLVQTDKWDDTIDQFTNIDTILQNNIDTQFHDNVFLPGNPPALTGRKANYISSCNYSSYASTLLINFNPQEGESNAPSTQQKRLRTADITYAKAVMPTSFPPTSQTSVSTLTDFEKNTKL
jgi:hypothetical protein